jgi:ESS family glutamate:Na+ symporter
MLALQLNLAETLGLSIAVLLLGRLLMLKIPFLNKFCIPQPVVGGLVFALLTLAGNLTGTFSITLDTTLQTFFMLCFFTTVGFSASLSALKKAGVGVAIFLAVAAILCVLQDAVGVGLAVLFGKNPLFGLAVGSIPMTGGHGTAAAFGPLLEEVGLTSGSSIAVAAATFGLISGSLMGGPTARRLIMKFGLTAKTEQAEQSVEEVLQEETLVLDAKHLCNGFFQIGVAVGLGSIVSKLIAQAHLTMPPYIGAMFVAACLRNIFVKENKWSIRVGEIQALGEIFLGIFLAQALMNLRLWELADLALPLFVILFAQVLLMFLYSTFCTFMVMGRDYDAAVMAAGHCGFGLGAVPNAIANMSAVTRKYGPSNKAFFIIPVTGALFIDFVNSGIIVAFINFFT